MGNLKTFQEIEKLLVNFVHGRTESPENSQISLQAICFYPGSFNPWHEGHTSCVNLHIKYFPQIPLMVLPDHSPHKELTTLSEIHENLPGAYISHVFKQIQKTNPTYNWISYLKSQRPSLQLGLLIGLDSFLNFPKWHKYQDLLQILSFIEVVPRKIENLAVDMHQFEKKLMSLAPKLKISHIPENPFDSVSSTILRQK